MKLLVSNLGTKTTLTTVKNKIPSVSNLVKKTDYNTRVTEIENQLNNHNHDKDSYTSECNKWWPKQIIESFKYFKVISSTNYISSWKSKGLSKETIKPPATSDNSLNPNVSYNGTKARLEFRGSCLKQDKSTFNHEK